MSTGRSPGTRAYSEWPALSRSPAARYVNESPGMKPRWKYTTRIVARTPPASAGKTTLRMVAVPGRPAPRAGRSTLPLHRDAALHGPGGLDVRDPDVEHESRHQTQQRRRDRCHDVDEHRGRKGLAWPDPQDPERGHAGELVRAEGARRCRDRGGERQHAQDEGPLDGIQR